jgi:hypothetical protein
MIYVTLYENTLIMRFKNELYPQEQEAIKSELLNIICLDDKNSIVLYNVDNDEEKQTNIMKLLPRIRTFFSMSRVTAFSYPERIQRPWLSIIKHLLKDDYDIMSKDCKIKSKDGITIRTKRYTFTKKQ